MFYRMDCSLPILSDRKYIAMKLIDIIVIIVIILAIFFAVKLYKNQDSCCKFGKKDCPNRKY